MVTEVRTTPEWVELAHDQSKSMGKLPNSITDGEGNTAGFLGEIVVADMLGADQTNTYDFDLSLPWGATVDVKTKRTGYAPKPHYECSVAALNTKQDCDYYVFTRCKNDVSTVWVLGHYPKDEYFKDATFHKKGDYDTDNDFTFTSDCYNLPLGQLKPTSELFWNFDFAPCKGSQSASVESPRK